MSASGGVTRRAKPDPLTQSILSAQSKRCAQTPGGQCWGRFHRHGNKYRFFTRYRSDDPSSLAVEFDAPFARLDYVSRDCFDLLWHRHTGEWLRLFERQSLADALHQIASEPYFQPC